MVPEAKLKQTEAGLVPEGEGWFVVSAREARWGHTDDLGSFVPFEGGDGARFPELGINVNVLRPGQPSSMYHAENTQEDFLVLAGECVAIVEGQERQLRAWDFVHCPPGTAHVFVAAGEQPCVLLAVGARSKKKEEFSIVYPVDEAARKRGAGVEEETTKPDEAYAGCSPLVEGRYRDGDLPER